MYVILKDNEISRIQLTQVMFGIFNFHTLSNNELKEFGIYQIANSEPPAFDKGSFELKETFELQGDSVLATYELIPKSTSRSHLKKKMKESFSKDFVEISLQKVTYSCDVDDLNEFKEYDPEDPLMVLNLSTKEYDILSAEKTATLIGKYEKLKKRARKLSKALLINPESLEIHKAIHEELESLLYSFKDLKEDDVEELEE